MRKIMDPLASPSHLAILVPLLLFGSIVLGGDALGLWSPNYRKVFFWTVFAYWISVAYHVWYSRSAKNR